MSAPEGGHVPRAAQAPPPRAPLAERLAPGAVAGRLTARQLLEAARDDYVMGLLVRAASPDALARYLAAIAVGEGLRALGRAVVGAALLGCATALGLALL